MKTVANYLTRCKVIFSNLRPNYNKLTQSKVDAITTSVKETSGKIQELLTDEFIEMYHLPQVKSIKASFDKLYQSVYSANSVYTKPLVNGGAINTGFNINNYSHFK